MTNHHKINYVEFPAKNMAKTKLFFAKAFDWKFQDYGPEYCAITNAGIDGGFFKSSQESLTSNGSTLLVIYSDALEETLNSVVSLGGKIIKPIFEFPGGRRFHFTEPSGNEFAVWGE
ncbi:MAG: VOC family protein [Kangiellaceae bacterium]